MKFSALMVAVALGVVLLAPAPAFAVRSWTEGSSTHPLSAGATDEVEIGEYRRKPAATLKRKILWEYAGSSDEFDPFYAETLGNGNLLVTSRSNEVLEITRGGRLVWSYTRLKDDPRLSNTYSAKRLPNGNTLITDRRADFVIEVTPSGQQVWQYGAIEDSHAPGSLVDPFYAEQLPNGNVLITDNRGGNRVIEVRKSDYDPDAPNLGYTESSIVWQYGQAGVPGLGPGQLVSPRHATLLANGNVLVTDAGDRDAESNRVVELARSGEIVWIFGEPGVLGNDDKHLNRPSSAQRLPSGNTLIVEEDGGRMLEVDDGGAVVDSYGAGSRVPEGGEVAKVRGVHRTDSGTLLVDQGHTRLLELGYPDKGTMTSAPLTLGMPGVRKTISRIAVDANAPNGTSVSLQYSLDGSGWRGSGTNVKLPADSVARSIRYRLTLKTSKTAYTPAVKEVRIDFEVAPDEDEPETTSGTKKSTSSGSGGSSTRSSTGASGSGASSAGSGTGSGSGAGAGSGSGTRTGSASGEVALATPGMSGTLSGGAASGGPSLTRGTLLAPVGGGEGGVGSQVDGTGWGAPEGGSAGSAALVFLGVVYLTGFGGTQAVRVVTHRMQG